MNKPIILTSEGIARLEMEIDEIENKHIPLAKKELKKWRLWGDEICTKEAKDALKGLKKRLSVIKSMLEEATRV